MDNIYHQDHVRAVVAELDEMTQFIRSIYNLALPFICITVFLWVLLMILNIHLDALLPFPIYFAVIVIFLVMVGLHCIPQMATNSPCKWIMTSLVVLCTIVAGSCIVAKMHGLTMTVVVLAVTLVIVVLNFSGAKCPQDFLPGGVFSTLLMILLLVVMVVVGIAQLFTGSPTLLNVFVSILFIMVVIAIPIQAQFNHGRLDVVEVVPKQHLFVCILTLYLHSVMFFCCVCYFILVEEARASPGPTTVDEDE